MTEFSPAELEAGRLLFARPWDFVKGCVRIDDLPPTDRTEIAFAGRSNVGKSSLINALTGRVNLARTSNTPGRTQELNIFEANDAPLRIVDMPGYGFAKAPKKTVETWTRLIHAYLQGRPNLRRVFVLIDGRHGPKPADETVMNELDSAAVSYQIVLTKADKPKAGELEKIVAKTDQIIAKHGAAHPEMLITSSEKKDGIDGLRAVIAQLLAT
ncbi:ribosome biogenesis GTP-binding protein YihA/YsxC [Maritalea mediterranea]|uniref:Probable GTP-binding protein EngB n=1 Tax=Maritalea mediterranea TaxID=2909667 RepID=A0ABS9E3R2_9HYPH|nr:ribosome biogenesis GTP-binding protein YihA/YsxC [Maritalea mediterranea]MCF4097505.1 ribosome biogenesis GTP-binding protein YihA/YsxC [Maritalea mediterranea]